MMNLLIFLLIFSSYIFCIENDQAFLINETSFVKNYDEVREQIRNSGFIDPNSTFFVIDNKVICFVYACAKLGLMDELYKSKANINIRNQDGLTPLMLALRDQEHNAVIALINAGADCYITDFAGKDFFDYAEYKIANFAEFRQQRLRNQEIAILYELELNENKKSSCSCVIL